MSTLVKRAFFALCLIFLLGCASTPSCRQWELQEICTNVFYFNGARLILHPDSIYSYLELEIKRNRSGIRFYINLLMLQAQPWLEDPTRTKVEIDFEGEETWTIYPFFLEGGQKLLLSDDVADILLNKLLDEKPFTIHLGQSYISVVPDNFSNVYRLLLKVPIE